MTGSIQGLVVALLIIYGVTDLFENYRKGKNDKKPKGAVRYELDSPNSGTIN